jgi:ATP-dependent DNA ligase
VSLLAAQTPARLVAFDLLACGSADLRDQPFAVRRTALAALLVEAPAPVVLTPSTTDPREARQWLGAPAGAGIDGVVAKDPDSRYQPGRRVMVKVKHERTVECVVAGFRVFTDRPVVSSLLLGLWDGAALRHVGLVQSFPETARMELLDRLRPLLTPIAGHPWEQGFAVEGGPTGRLKGAAGRWVPGMTQDWAPVRPELVAEVGFDQLDGLRFRHPAQLKRWRPDRDAASCTIDQLAAAT